MKPLRFVLAVPRRAANLAMPSIVETPEQVCTPVPALWCDSETPWHFANGRCCVIGVAFSRGTFRRLSSVVEPVPDCATAGATARYLVTKVWGGYFAIIEDHSKGHIGLLVDPSGLLPVYHLTTPDHDLYASDPRLFARSGTPGPPVSYLALHAHLLKPELRRRVTCLEGIEELAPGVLHFPGMPEEPPQAIWHAADFLPSAQILDFEEYADQLKGLSTVVIQCWSESLGKASVAASGGVDSSLICAALAHAEQRFDCVTLATLDPTGDERIYARRVADWFKVRCAERVYDPALYDPNRSASEGLPRPARRSFQQVLDILLLDATTELGASTIYDGNGGDNLFCFLHSSAPVVDRLAAEGLGAGACRTLVDMCRITGCSIPSMGAAAFRRYFRKRRKETWRDDTTLLVPQTAKVSAEALMPWLTNAPQAVSGKRDHLALIMRAQNHIHGLSAGLPRFSPLASQPLVEFCLGVPTWIWASGGKNRALARAAFADCLPRSVLARTSKAGPDSFVRQAFARNRTVIGERLLDGLLAANGLIDRKALTAALRTDETDDSSMFGRVLDLLEAENWARSWIG